jgi:hypothetical protein
MSKPKLAEERITPDETQFTDALLDLLKKNTLKDTGDSMMRRSLHAKMHCVVKAEFIVEPNLPEAFRIGVFKEPKTFTTWIRFSNSDGTIKHDKRKDIRGMAIKLMNVPGDKILEKEMHEQTQDFILINAPVFVAADVKEFSQLLAAFLGSVWAKLKFFLTHPRIVWIFYRTMLKFANPLQIRYFSTTPYLFGDQAVKYSATPLFIVPDTIPDAPSDDYLRLSIANQLRETEAIFDFSVQLQTDPETMPIEDAMCRWSELASPFRKVATIRILQQDCDNNRQMMLGENLSFTPWHALPEHRPLGSINRARKTIYETRSSDRHAHNHVSLKEPKDWEM